MSSDFLVNAFQVPNALVDKAMRHLSGSELKCYLLIVRKTLGWHKKVDRISISQFMEDTGLSNRVVIAACENLTKYKLIECTKDENGNKFFSVNFCQLDTYDEKSHVTKSHSPYDEKSQFTYDEKSHTKDTIKNTIQKTIDSSPDDKPKAKREKFDESQFEQFWSVWPKRVGKEAAKKAWAKIKITDDLLITIIKAVNTQKATWTDLQFVKNPATWLNGKCWEDEILPASQNQPHPHQPALQNAGYVPPATAPSAPQGRRITPDAIKKLKESLQ